MDKSSYARGSLLLRRTTRLYCVTYGVVTSRTISCRILAQRNEGEIRMLARIYPRTQLRKDAACGNQISLLGYRRQRGVFARSGWTDGWMGG